MTNIVIVDIDGVVANNGKRMHRAGRALSTHLQQHIAESDLVKVKEIVKQAEELYWHTAFTPDLVDLDTLIDGSVEALCELEKHYKIIFLTSRPEMMREATMAWLQKHEVFFNHTIHGDRHLILKPLAFQFTKTPVWKAGMVQTLALFYSARIVKFVDDEQANWDELLKHTPYVQYSLEWIQSLKECVEHLREELAK